MSAYILHLQVGHSFFPGMTRMFASFALLYRSIVIVLKEPAQNINTFLQVKIVPECMVFAEIKIKW